MKRCWLINHYGFTYSWKLPHNYSFQVRICSLPLYEKKNAIKYRLFLEYNKQKFTESCREEQNDDLLKNQAVSDHCTFYQVIAVHQASLEDLCYLVNQYLNKQDKRVSLDLHTPSTGSHFSQKNKLSRIL